jgi:hypothetical protein
LLWLGTSLRNALANEVDDHLSFFEPILQREQIEVVRRPVPEMELGERNFAGQLEGRRAREERGHEVALKLCEPRLHEAVLVGAKRPASRSRTRAAGRDGGTARRTFPSQPLRSGSEAVASRCFNSAKVSGSFQRK